MENGNGDGLWNTRPTLRRSQMGAFISGEYLFHDNTIASDIDKIHTNDNITGVMAHADNAVSLTILIPMRLHLPLQRNDIVILRP